jgi:hypothetical protein
MVSPEVVVPIEPTDLAVDLRLVKEYGDDGPRDASRFLTGRVAPARR